MGAPEGQAGPMLAIMAFHAAFPFMVYEGYHAVGALLRLAAFAANAPLGITAAVEQEDGLLPAAQGGLQGLAQGNGNRQVTLEPVLLPHIHDADFRGTAAGGPTFQAEQGVLPRQGGL